MGTRDALEALLAPAVKAEGFRLVRLRLLGGKPSRLQVMAERADGRMDVEDCAQLSRALSDVLEAADPISQRYVLEVSSPGIDRPLMGAADFARFAGHEARIELTSAIAGRRRFTGLLIGTDGADVVMDVAVSGETERVRLPLAAIAEAQLLLTDRLIRESLKARDMKTMDKV